MRAAVRWCLRKLERTAVAFFSILLNIWHAAISPLFGQRCRFYPSCSQYAVTALKKHGLIFGVWLSLKRFCRCNQFFDGGVDPVP